VCSVAKTSHFINRDYWKIDSGLIFDVETVGAGSASGRTRRFSQFLEQFRSAPRNRTVFVAKPVLAEYRVRPILLKNSVSINFGRFRGNAA
jgi:hypothetical protein